MRGAQPAMSASFLAMPDLRLAAWFLWMTPLLAALSSALLAVCRAVVAAERNADVKGAAASADYALERAVRRIVAIRRETGRGRV